MLVVGVGADEVWSCVGTIFCIVMSITSITVNNVSEALILYYTAPRFKSLD
jgi:hypothetical protein